jgi:dihydropteroate synthase
MTSDQFLSWLSNPARRPLIMGVLNVTPDSFSDGGRFFAPDAAVAHARQMCASGADILDIGGESTRPGAQRVDAAEQIRRILPVMEALGPEFPAILSVDTTRAEVARAAIDHGASIVNDISAGRDDPGIFLLVARTGVALILMHMQGQPANMQAAPTYGNVTAEVMDFLDQRSRDAQAQGVSHQRILIDPGIGFGKTAGHNLQLLRELSQLRRLERPLVVGVSRKSFLGKITGESDASARVMGTAAAVAWCAANGADILRVHDVAQMTQVVRVVMAIRDGGPEP